jgi:RimJ/RimL family protein N-acetyltransferase
MIGASGVHHGEEPEIYYFPDPAAAVRGAKIAALRAFAAVLFVRFPLSALPAVVFTDNPASARILDKLGVPPTDEGTGNSLQRLEPAAVWKYRLTREAFGA